MRAIPIVLLLTSCALLCACPASMNVGSPVGITVEPLVRVGGTLVVTFRIPGGTRRVGITDVGSGAKRELKVGNDPTTTYILNDSTLPTLDAGSSGIQHCRIDAERESYKASLEFGVLMDPDAQIPPPMPILSTSNANIDAATRGIADLWQGKDLSESKKEVQRTDIPASRSKDFDAGTRFFSFAYTGKYPKFGFVESYRVYSPIAIEVTASDTSPVQFLSVRAIPPS